MRHKTGWLICGTKGISQSTTSFLVVANMALVSETAFWLQSLILFVFMVRNCSLNLIVNIKAKDGEIVQQTFFADPEKDYVTIDFKNNQGRFVTVYIDFRLVS